MCAGRLTPTAGGRRAGEISGRTGRKREGDQLLIRTVRTGGRGFLRKEEWPEESVDGGEVAGD
jgi:hypothetical protein